MLNRKQVAALVRVASFNRDSGACVVHVACGADVLRYGAFLYMAAVASVRANPAIKDFYRRLCERVKQPKPALTACMRKTYGHPQRYAPQQNILALGFSFNPYRCSISAQRITSAIAMVSADLSR